MKCKDVVTMLFGFMNVSQLRNWLVHLNTLEEIIPFITAVWTESTIAECYHFIYQIYEH